MVPSHQWLYVCLYGLATQQLTLLVNVSNIPKAFKFLLKTDNNDQSSFSITSNFFQTHSRKRILLFQLDMKLEKFKISLELFSLIHHEILKEQSQNEFLRKIL